ncbi:MAG: DUF4139 domain-containing protein [Planctomycetota bacterium]
MNRHLTERELIEYRFKLAAEDQAGAIAAHLDGCAECRERLERLNAKFAALDLLREDVRASEELISQAIEQAKRPAQGRIVPFYKSHWFGAVAAVLVVGFVIVIGSLTGEKTKQQEFATAPAPRPKEEESLQVLMVAKEPDATRAAAPTAQLAQKSSATTTSAVDMEKERQPARGLADSATTVGAANAVALDSISEQPPFAPASAIELVVLPRREKVQLTIYNSADLTLVRERRNLTLKKGWNWLQFMWANTLIDPTSLALEPLEQGDKINIQQLVFPARLRELGRWLIRSEISGQVPFEITYFTSGLSWRAFYVGTLSQDEKTMRLDGYVRVGNNSGEDYENAQTRLIVGKVHILDQIAELARRPYPYDRPGMIEHDKYESESLTQAKDVSNMLFGVMDSDAPSSRRKEITKEGLSEYFLYTIEGTETIANQWGKRLLSFEAEDIEVESLYKYDEEQWGNQAIRFVKFTNDEEHNLGQTPIPDGSVKMYGRADEQGLLSFVGGTNIKYIPVNEEVELNLGPARLVKVEPKLMDFKTENYLFDNTGNVAGWDEIRTWKIEITNTRTLPIQVEITRGFATAYWTLQADVPYDKHDATHVRFNINLEPRSKRTFDYTVRTYHGRREETLRQ